MPDEPALGITVLVTRPREQANALTDALVQRGANVIALPVIDIVPVDRRAIEIRVDTLDPADVTVFISTNAVRHGVEFASGQIAAIGEDRAE